MGGERTLVARGIRPEEVFAAVTSEIGRLVGAEYAFMGRYEPDGMLVVVATWVARRTALPWVAGRGLGGRTS